MLGNNSVHWLCGSVEKIPKKFQVHWCGALTFWHKCTTFQPSSLSTAPVRANSRKGISNLPSNFSSARKFSGGKVVRLHMMKKQYMNRKRNGLFICGLNFKLPPCLERAYESSARKIVPSCCRFSFFLG